MKARDNNLVTTRRAQNNRMQLLSFLEQTFPFQLKMEQGLHVFGAGQRRFSKRIDITAQ